MATMSSADDAIAPPPPPPLPHPLTSEEEEEAEEEEEESLDAYFEACRASSSSSLSSVSSSASIAENEKDAGGVQQSNAHLTNSHWEAATPSAGEGDSNPSQLSPLQGSVPRPLLLRQRRTSGGRVGLDASSPLNDPATTTHATVTKETTIRQPTDLSAPVWRGAAGRDLADQLQFATLPLAPSDASWHLTGDSTAAAAVTATSDVFDFHLPSAASSSKSSQSSTIKEKRKATTTITTRGRNGRSPSSASTPDGRAERHARQRAVLFDVLCALRQHTTASCIAADEENGNEEAPASSASSVGKTWHLTESVKAEARAQQWPSSFLGALEALLVVANDVAAVEAQVDVFERVCTARDGVDPAADPLASVGVRGAAAALESTGQQTLRRLSRVLRQLHADFLQWVLQVQEYLVVVCEHAFNRGVSRHSAPLSRSSSYNNNEEEEEESASAAAAAAAARYRSCDGVLPSPYSLLDVVLAVQSNSIPLQRCRVLMEESGCFDGLSETLSRPPQPSTATAATKGRNEEGSSSSPPSPPPPSVSFATLAARLLDTLIIQASAVQDTSTMDLYRFYVLLLLYAAWPYVLLCTAAIFGFVRGIDPPVWRRQLPRLFRSSFSHVRVGDAHRHYPTDILSLLLNCVGYYNAAEVFTDDRNDGDDSSGDGAATAAATSTRWQFVKGSRRMGGSNSRDSHHGDTSEHHVALAALASARTFVLRSLASFTRRKQQVTLSRTPVHPSSAGVHTGQFKKARPEGTANSCPNGGGGSGGSGGTTVPWQHWQKKSVKEILHYIMYESGGNDRSEDDNRPEAPQSRTSTNADAAGAAVVAYAQENQDVRRRVLQRPPDSTTEGQQQQHYRYYPTTIPLGFATMAAEALPGQQTWQQQRAEAAAQAERNGGGPIPMPAPIPLPSLPPLQQRGPGSRDAAYDGENEEKGNSSDRSSHGDPLQRRAMSLWTLFIAESATAPDVLFANAYTAAEELRSDGDDADALRYPDGRVRRAHQLWINITIPCARWVTTALLIPIGVAVQRLQERRLRDLFTVSLQAVNDSGGVAGLRGRSTPDDVRHRGGDGTGLLWQNNEEGDGSEGGSPGHRGGGVLQCSGGQGFADPTTTAAAAMKHAALPRTPAAPGPACSFLHALKLVVDTALCRDQERLVFGFLERLYREPRWWARRWVDGGAASFERLGTAAPAVSALFTEALRGKRLGELVRLVVLPANEIRKRHPSAATTAAASASESATSLADTGTVAPPASTITSDILDVFASFQLEFTFPDAFALILQPRDLSVYVQPVTNTTERSYQTFFWQRRRRQYVEEAASATDTAAVTASSAAKTTAMGIAFADVWSYVFGYQCSLYYAQITLREQKKLLHQRDTQDFQVAQTMGQPGPRVVRQLQYVARGLGSAYYTLNFAVDTLLSFTQAEAMRAVYDLEHLLHTAMRASPGLHSCMELCHELDALLLRLHGIAFPARPAVALNARERAMMQSPAAEAVRGAVQRILAVALDPSRLPVSYISSSTRNSVEALVAAVTAAAEQQSMFASRLHPLRVMLTFNKYYGTPEETLSYRFR